MEPKYSRDDIDYSVIKLKESDFIKAIIRSYDNRLVILSLDDITNEGHKFLEQLRSDSILNKCTEYAKNEGINYLKDVFKNTLVTADLLSKVTSLFS